MRKKGKNEKLDGGWMIIEPKHKLVLKDFVTKRSHCDDPKCKFYGQLAEQGVCHTVLPDAMSKYFAQLMKGAEETLKFNREHNYKGLSQKEIFKRMESEVVCAHMNYRSCLDELIWLRGENAKLRGKLGLFKK